MAQLESPAWFDAALVQKALRRGGDEDATVKSVTLRPVCAAGDNYGSTMFRITTETTAGTQSHILKTLPPGEHAKNFAKEVGFFRTEGCLLRDAIPKMQGLLQEVAPGNYPKFAPNCLYSGQHPQEYLVMEDLAPKGFRLADRHRGLGLRHSLLALRALARFHAASAALLLREPSLVSELKSPYIAETDSFRSWLATNLQVTADTCRQWHDFPQDCIEALEAAKKDSSAKIVRINRYREEGFNVINHGDFWTNNMMFRYDEGTVCDVLFVDLQLSHVASPAVDILYFLYSSVSANVSEHYLNMLVREYYVTLRDTMESLGLKAPSLREILQDLDESGFHGVYAAVCVLPLAKAKEVPDNEEFFSGNAEANCFMYSDPDVERWFRRILPDFHRRGLLS